MPEVVTEALKALRVTQAAERRRAGSRWQEHDLVFASTVGTLRSAGNVRRDFQAICQAAGLGKEWTPRELRHSFVSVLSADGVAVEDISHLVGHSSTRTTERGRRQSRTCGGHRPCERACCGDHPSALRPGPQDRADTNLRSGASRPSSRTGLSESMIRLALRSKSRRPVSADDTSQTQAAAGDWRTRNDLCKQGSAVTGSPLLALEVRVRLRWGLPWPRPRRLRCLPGPPSGAGRAR